jgi:DNA-binding HxlR family transcriptional regulator
MNAEQSIAIMKALADKSRLAIVRSLLEQTQYVEEIAKRHALAPSTVSFHLKKLEQAGIVSSRKEQYYLVVQANEVILNTTLREIISASPVRKDLQDERIDEYRRKTLATFFRHGALEKLPAQHKKRSIVLEEFALRFEAGRRYSESEVTGLIKPLFNDYCVIRRLLVDEGMIFRDKATYWREIRDNDRPVEIATAPKALAVKKGEGRAEIKRNYKKNRPDMGVYQIKNKVTGKIFIDSSSNLEGTFKSKSFQLKMGKAVFNRELQKDLNELGADSFELSVLEILPKPQSEDNVERLLLARKLHWQEKMQPFAELGYNSQKRFQREREQL